MTRAAIIGFGRQGKQILNAMLSIPEIETIGVCDINANAFSSLPGSESWEKSFPKTVNLDSPAIKTYTDDIKMLGEQKPELLAVATWTKDHANVIADAALCGGPYKTIKAILCEEPIATSLVDARFIVNQCAEIGALLTVNHTRRWWPEHQKMREIIQSGANGELRNIWISCGGARLGDLGTHWIDWARWVVEDDVRYVTAHLQKIEWPNPRGPQFEDYPGDIYITFKNGVSAFINESAGIALPPRYEVVGTKGRILIEEYMGEFDKWVVEVREEGGQPNPITDYYGKIVPLPFTPTRKIDFKEMAAAPLRELLGGETSCDGKEGYKTLEVLVAAHISGLQGRRYIDLQSSSRRDFDEMELKNA